MLEGQSQHARREGLLLVAHSCPAPPPHRVCTKPSDLAPLSPPAATSHSQNLTSWSALPLTNPEPSGSAATDLWDVPEGRRGGGWVLVHACHVADDLWGLAAAVFK